MARSGEASASEILILFPSDCFRRTKITLLDKYCLRGVNASPAGEKKVVPIEMFSNRFLDDLKRLANLTG